MANYSFSGLQTFAFKSLRLRQGIIIFVQERDLAILRRSFFMGSLSFMYQNAND